MDNQTLIEPKKEEVKIEGVLLLLAVIFFYTALSAFSKIGDSIEQFTSIETWNSLTTQGSPSYHPLWAFIIYFEIGFQALMICFPIALWILLFRKHKHFPRLYLGYTVLYALFEIIYFGLFKIVNPELANQIIPNMSKAIIFSLLSFAYINNSKRVRRTFYNEIIEDKNEKTFF